MPTYANAENSSVRSYEVLEDGISITFKGGRTYSYTRNDNGDVTIDTMIELAKEGSGLNAYINRSKPTYS